MKLVLTGAVAALVLSGCGSGAQPSAVTVTASATATVMVSASPTPSRTPSSSPSPTLKAPTTALVFLKAILPLVRTARPSVVFNEETDPNDLLGRPNGYTSKVAFTDSRIDASEGEKGSVDRGGSIETYPDAAGALARAQYIQSVHRTNPITGAEYTYVAGNSVLRLSSVLTPKQARAYAAAASAATGRPAQLVTGR